MPVTEGIMIFADRYPSPPPSGAAPLVAERRSQLASADLYDGKLMFHGPAFQGVVGLERSGENGLAGHLRTLEFGTLFHSIAAPRLVTDPLVLDAAGQLVGFWAAEYLNRGFVVFPYHLDRLTIYGPNRPAGQRLACSLSVLSTGKESITSNIEIAGPDGVIWMTLQGWADRRFDPPERFHRAWITPHEAMISEPWRTPLAKIPSRDALECCRVSSMFDESNSLWKELWASLILTRRERQEFGARREAGHRQIEWLAGRTAAKDAVRSYLRTRYNLQLLPADIDITQDERCSPIAGGSWTRDGYDAPHLCLAHSDTITTAVAYDGSRGRRCGIDVQTVRELASDFETLAFTAEEQRLLDAVPRSDRQEWCLRLWSAKEAVAKALGRNQIAEARNVHVLALDRQTGIVAAAGETSGERLPVYTARDGDSVCATAIVETRTR
jgi:phosphopantetheinyl transferase (holo-ACP synthase)